MSHQQQVADRLKQLRRKKAYDEARDVTQAEVADAVGLVTETFTRYEGGKRKIPDEVVIALATFYGVTPSFIRYGTEPATRMLRVAGLEIDVATLERVPDEELERLEAELSRIEAQRAAPEPRKRVANDHHKGKRRR